MAIDHAVSRAVFLAHALERAVHHPGPWQLALNGTYRMAERLIGEEGVSFSATFPVPGTALGELSLLCDGEIVLSKYVELPDHGEQMQIAYELSLPTEVRA